MESGEKDGTDEPYLQGGNRGTDLENWFADTEGEGEGGMNWESNTDIYIYTSVCKIDS